jgi:putative ABC transport system substrate-binding protein
MNDLRAKRQQISAFLLRRGVHYPPDSRPKAGRHHVQSRHRSRITYLPSVETAARSLKVEPIIAPVHSDVEIETAITTLGREPAGGLVVMPEVFTLGHRAPIILSAARNNVPAVYGNSEFARAGGLLSYGFDQVDSFRRVATYVDRILRGAKPAELPDQLPTKFEMAVNPKTAKALGLTVPPSILLRATEVIE